MIRKPPWDGSFDTLTGRSYELSVYEQKNTKNVKCPKHLAVFYKSWHFLMDDVCDVLFSGVEGLYLLAINLHLSKCKHYVCVCTTVSLRVRQSFFGFSYFLICRLYEYSRIISEPCLRVILSCKMVWNIKSATVVWVLMKKKRMGWSTMSLIPRKPLTGK